MTKRIIRDVWEENFTNSERAESPFFLLQISDFHKAFFRAFLILSLNEVMYDKHSGIVFTETDDRKKKQPKLHMETS